MYGEISDALYEKLLSLDKQALLTVMLAALDSMQGYNGQTSAEAIIKNL